MAGWRHRCNGQNLGKPGDGQGRLVCCCPWGRRVRRDWATEQQEGKSTTLSDLLGEGRARGDSVVTAGRRGEGRDQACSGRLVIWCIQDLLSPHFPQVFSDIGAIQSLKRLVSYSTNGTTSALAKRALRLLGEEVPRRILPSVPSWKAAAVQTWLQQIGFSQYCENFRVEPHGVAGWQSEQAHPRGPRGL